jgi:hypothetical protein
LAGALAAASAAEAAGLAAAPDAAVDGGAGWAAAARHIHAPASASSTRLGAPNAVI